MVIELIQYYKTGLQTGVVFRFDKGVVEGIERSTYSERKITPSGRKFEPKDAWYRRRTDVLRIMGRLPRSKAVELQNMLLLPYPSDSPKEGYWWAVSGLKGVVDPLELWAWSAPLELRSERLFSREGEEYYSFRLEFRWMKRIGIRVIVEVYDINTNKPPAFAAQTLIYLDGQLIGNTDANGRLETSVDKGIKTFVAKNPWYSPNQVTKEIVAETTVRIGLAPIH